MSHKRMLLQWHVTERCNLRCAHCYQESGHVPELPFATLLGIIEQFKELLDRQAAKFGHVTVTGGEPFVRDDFEDLIDALSRQKPRLGFAILTNGTRIGDALARRLRAWGPRFVQVSIEGTRQQHDAIRGCGSSDSAVNAVKMLSRHRIPAFISFTAHRHNFREFPEVARLGSQTGATRVWADRLIPLGHGSALQTLTPDENREFISLVHAAASREHRRWFRRTEVARHRALQFLGDERCHPYHCTAGDTLITIQSNGDVVPCRRMPIVVGNVLANSLAAIYETSETLQQLRDDGHVPEDCSGCSHLAKCRGGLRCLSYAMTGDPWRRDPGCWLPASAEKIEQ